ncbi:MAG: circularly permuted type 2 ATP-grasp protein, partial [Pseudomonadales bacterium]
LLNVPSYLCSDPDQRQFVLENLRDLVVKPANESGGYGMYIGPRETEKFTGKMRKQIVKNPRNYMAQPIISLSTVPTWIDDKLDPRHVDLRPFILQGKHNYVTAGGLTRVALVKGSLVVNSSQGGGSKDTWIVRTNVAEATARVV